MTKLNAADQSAQPSPRRQEETTSGSSGASTARRRSRAGESEVSDAVGEEFHCRGCRLYIPCRLELVHPLVCTARLATFAETTFSEADGASASSSRAGSTRTAAAALAAKKRGKWDLTRIDTARKQRRKSAACASASENSVLPVNEFTDVVYDDEASDGLPAATTKAARAAAAAARESWCRHRAMTFASYNGAMTHAAEERASGDGDGQQLLLDALCDEEDFTDRSAKVKTLFVLRQTRLLVEASRRK